jgi:hypothetical protein
LTSEELTEWQAYFRIEPFGEERADMRLGSWVAYLINATIGKAKFTPSDFHLSTEPPPPQTPEQMGMILKALADSYKVRAKPGRPRKPPRKA